MDRSLGAIKKCVRSKLTLAADLGGTVAKGDGYELMVKSILEAKVSGTAIERSEVSHNKKLRGKSGHEHQIDIVIEVRMFGINLLILVECKDYSRAVGIDELSEFAYRIADIGAHKGVFVTTEGFQRGAFQVAKAEGIALVVANDLEWRPGLSSPQGEVIASAQWIHDALSYLERDATERRVQTPESQALFAQLKQGAPDRLDDAYNWAAELEATSDPADPRRAFVLRTVTSNSLDRRFLAFSKLGHRPLRAPRAFDLTRFDGVAFQLMSDSDALLVRPRGLIELVVASALLSCSADSGQAMPVTARASCAVGRRGPPGGPM